MDNWHRKEYYHHYLNNVVCTYSITVNVDVTSLKGQKLYPAMLWLLTSTVNEMEEFRTHINSQGLGVFSRMNPSYTVFNKVSKTFSAIWTWFDNDYNVFLQAYQEDIDKYSSATCFAPKKDKPDNTFDVSMLPWATFTALNLNMHGEGSGKYLLPIFTMGKTFADGEKTLMPLAIQAHHAVCDGYHIGVFLEKLQDKINGFNSYTA